MLGHRARCGFRIARQQGLDDRQMLTCLTHDAQMILFVFPGDVAKRAEQQLQAADLFRQEAIAAGFGDQIVQLAVRLSARARNPRVGRLAA